MNEYETLPEALRRIRPQVELADQPAILAAAHKIVDLHNEVVAGVVHHRLTRGELDRQRERADRLSVELAELEVAIVDFLATLVETEAGPDDWPEYARLLEVLGGEVWP